MTFPAVDPASYGAALQYDKMPDGTNVGYGMSGNSLTGFSLFGLVNYPGTNEWGQCFQYGMEGDEESIIESIEIGNWQKVFSPAPPAAPNTFTWAELAAGITAGGVSTSYNGVTGTEAVASLFDAFMTETTTHDVLACLGTWDNGTILPQIQKLFDETLNAVAVPIPGPPSPPVPPLPPAQLVGGIPTASALWSATNTLLQGASGLPLAGSPCPWRFVIGLKPIPTT